MKAVVCLIVGLSWIWHVLMYDLSKAYEWVFLVFHYEYVGFDDPQYRRELSWGKKIICLKEYATDAMMEKLHHIEEIPDQRVLNNRENGLTKETFFLGHHFVIKSGNQKGFIQNLLFIGLGTDIWNNAHWMKERGLPVLKPIALVEKRKWNRTLSFVVYLYEGEMCERELKKRDDFFIKIGSLKEQLYQQNVVHHDFRLRNMVVLDDGEVQFIDIDKVHWYPQGSYVFQQRMKREMRKFHSNMLEKTGYTKRIDG